ncbi:metallophosphoesterase [Fulvivirga sediminis]|uniref:Metallophosphoesterase family protein n=1 Tax=Fulvivirga sediminis TaxID=2803949 RepID=A0A937FC24_9BACT|nr:metallophosphoesterase [Fulvivirga sediminis]MBL3658439.1 metallophosphoesterase family protein [Fulvivirga sediminis]
MNRSNVFTLIFIAIAGCLCIYCSSPKKELSNAKLLRSPYLQCAFKDSLTILWRTDSGEVCHVEYRSSKQEQWKKTTGTTRTTNTEVIENEVVIHGLVPNKKYEYKIFTNQKELLQNESLWFRSPLTKKDTAFTFFAVGDIGEPVDKGGTPDVLAKALEPHVDSLDFGLLLGDIVYPDGSSQRYDKNLFQYFTKVFPYVPTYALLGNHDWQLPDDFTKEWKLPHNEHYYSFEYGKTHFIGLDSKVGDFYDYEKQVEWLKNDLKNRAKDTEWTIVFLHHNGKSCTYKKDYDHVVALYPVFEEAKVDLVLNGHAHTYERLNPMNSQGDPIQEYIGKTEAYHNPKGFISITVGSGGKLRGIGSDPKPFTPDPEHCRHPNLVAKANHLWAYLQLSIEGRTLKAKAIGSEKGDIVDEFTIEK